MVPRRQEAAGFQSRSAGRHYSSASLGVMQHFMAESRIQAAAALPAASPRTDCGGAPRDAVAAALPARSRAPTAPRYTPCEHGNSARSSSSRRRTCCVAPPTGRGTPPDAPRHQDAGRTHPQRLLDQPPQRDLPGALEVGLARLHRDDVGQRNPESEATGSAQVCGSTGLSTGPSRRKLVRKPHRGRHEAQSWLSRVSDAADKLS